MESQITAMGFGRIAWRLREGGALGSWTDQVVVRDGEVIPVEVLGKGREWLGRRVEWGGFVGMGTEDGDFLQLRDTWKRGSEKALLGGHHALD